METSQGPLQCSPKLYKSWRQEHLKPSSSKANTTWSTWSTMSPRSCRILLGAWEASLLIITCLRIHPLPPVNLAGLSKGVVDRDFTYTYENSPRKELLTVGIRTAFVPMCAYKNPQTPSVQFAFAFLSNPPAPMLCLCATLWSISPGRDAPWMPCSLH